MKILDPGHEYLLEGVGETADQRVVFVKNEGVKYPGNTGFHGGILTQELLRVCIDRTRYMNTQGSCLETEHALAAMQSALGWYEVRAARCRGTHIEAEHIDGLDAAPVCKVCGHNQCHREVHDRTPGTKREAKAENEIGPDLGASPSSYTPQEVANGQDSASTPSPSAKPFDADEYDAVNWLIDRLILINRKYPDDTNYKQCCSDMRSEISTFAATRVTEAVEKAIREYQAAVKSSRELER